MFIYGRKKDTFLWGDSLHSSHFIQFFSMRTTTRERASKEQGKSEKKSLEKRMGKRRDQNWLCSTEKKGRGLGRVKPVALCALIYRIPLLYSIYTTLRLLSFKCTLLWQSHDRQTHSHYYYIRGQRGRNRDTPKVYRDDLVKLWIFA